MTFKNNLCWCGSNKDYTTCHFNYDQKIKKFKNEGAIVPDRNIVKNKMQIDAIKESGKINTAILDEISKFIRPGISTLEINDLIHKLTLEKNAIPAPLNFNGYPKSCCTSLNDVVCHGIPNENDILEEGDILNIDISTEYNGYFSDASRMFKIGDIHPELNKLVDVAKECLDLGFNAVKPFGYLNDISLAIESHAKKNGYSVVREFGGHGIGLEFHEKPFISHVVDKNSKILLTPGMIFTIEPMINMGTCDVFVDIDDDWTVLTDDGMPSAQWEYTVLITEDGAEIISC